MGEKRLVKRNIQRYNQIHRNIHRKIREAEESHAKQGAFHLHKKLIKIINIFKRTSILNISKKKKEEKQDFNRSSGYLEYSRNIFVSYSMTHARCNISSNIRSLNNRIRSGLRTISTQEGKHQDRITYMRNW